MGEVEIDEVYVVAGPKGSRKQWPKGAARAQDKLPLYLGFFQFVHNARRRGKALLGALIAGLVA